MDNFCTFRRNLSCRLVMKTKDSDTSNKKHDNKSRGYTYSYRWSA